jgi:hypothetical protein
MDDLQQAVNKAISFADRNGIEVPPDLLMRARRAGATKAEGDLTAINARYHDAITTALVGYFEGGSLVAARNAFRREMVQAMGDAFDLGWVDGGGEMPPDQDVTDWLSARMDAEMGHIEMLFEQAKALKKEEDFDYFTWAVSRADGYTNSLRDAYNTAKLRAMKDQMVTFDGEDGAESCDDCRRYKGQRRKISWFVARDAVPPFGIGLECHPGGRCQHVLVNDEGEAITV